MGKFSMMVCPLCARSRKVYSKGWADPEIRWDFWGEDSPIIQIREGGGKKTKEERGKTTTIGKPQHRGWAPGKGFRTIQTFSLAEAIKNIEYKKYVEDMINQIEKIHEIVQQYK